MILLGRFDSPEEAHLMRSFLASRGIGSTVLDEYVAQLFWHYRYATGGVRLVLDDPDDLEDAEAACQEYFAELKSQVRTEEPARGWPLVLVLSLLVGAPFLLFGRRQAVAAAEEE